MSTVKPQQILMPKKVHIADTAELHCTFNSNSDLLKELTKKGTTSLSSSYFATPVNPDELEITNILLSPTGINYYQVNITFIPWKTGAVAIPNLKFEDLEVLIEPVEIESISKQYKNVSLQETSAPLLLPGTTYKLYGAIISSFIILTALVLLIIKRKKVNFFLKTRKLKRKYKKNKKITIKKLQNLLIGENDENIAINDKEIAGQIQQILRNYLETRYQYPFTKVVTSELVPVFNEITQMLLSDAKNEAFGQIAAAFVRTDYIRYSTGALFLGNEKQELIENIIKNIEILENLEGDDDNA